MDCHSSEAEIVTAGLSMATALPGLEGIAAWKSDDRTMVEPLESQVGRA